MNSNYATIISLVAATTAIAAFFIARLKDAEERGALRQRVCSLEKRVDTFEAKVDKILEKLDRIQTDVHKLNQRNAELKGRDN